MPFGNTLHVSGHDGPLLAATLAAVRDPDQAGREIKSSLEDVFISLMDRARDNFA